MSDISVPGFGKQKKQTVYVIGGVVVAVIGIGYYRSRKNAAATAAAATTTATDTSSATDTSGSGYVDPNAAYGASAYGSGYVDPTTGLPLYSDTGTTQPTGFTSNSQWSQAAEEYLAGTVGLDATSVQAALGKYITGGNVTADQQNIIEQAIAAEGYPPQSGPNGYPPSIHLSPTVPLTQTPTVPSGPTASSPKYGTPISGTFIRNIANGAVYEVDTVNHVIYHLTYATAKKLAGEKQFPHVTDVLPSDARLKYTNGGNI